jgi:hypothetical protein
VTFFFGRGMRLAIFFAVALAPGFAVGFLLTRPGNPIHPACAREAKAPRDRRKA